MNYTESLKPEETIEQGIERLRKVVQIRDKMGGQLYWNIMNDDACELASQLSRRGADRDLLSEILGAGTHTR